ncbi:unnamed protein product, partial [Effrenium voratum]
MLFGRTLITHLSKLWGSAAPDPAQTEDAWEVAEVLEKDAWDWDLVEEDASSSPALQVSKTAVRAGTEGLETEWLSQAAKPEVHAIEAEEEDFQDAEEPEDTEYAEAEEASEVETAEEVEEAEEAEEAETAEEAEEAAEEVEWAKEVVDEGSEATGNIAPEVAFKPVDDAEKSWLPEDVAAEHARSLCSEVPVACETEPKACSDLAVEKPSADKAAMMTR